jgi:hypothetical protein
MLCQVLDMRQREQMRDPGFEEGGRGLETEPEMNGGSGIAER